MKRTSLIADSLQRGNLTGKYQAFVAFVGILTCETTATQRFLLNPLFAVAGNKLTTTGNYRGWIRETRFLLLIKRHEETNRTPDRIDFGILPTAERTECWLVIASTTMRYVRAKQAETALDKVVGAGPPKTVSTLWHPPSMED